MGSKCSHGKGQLWAIGGAVVKYKDFILGRYTEKNERISDILKYRYRCRYLQYRKIPNTDEKKYRKSVRYFRHWRPRCPQAFYAHKYTVKAKFHYTIAILLANQLANWFPTCRRQVRAISTCRRPVRSGSSTSSRAGRRLASDLLAS